MRRRRLKSVLAGHEFLKGLDDASLELLTGCAADIHVMAGDCLFKAGQQADHFYLIRKGRVRVALPISRRQTMAVQTIGEDEFLGWSWLIPPYRWHFEAQALEPVVALAFDGRCLRDKCERDTSFGYQMCQRFAAVMSRRIEELSLQLVGLCG